jgi:hypothetical protein
LYKKKTNGAQLCVAPGKSDSESSSLVDAPAYKMLNFIRISTRFCKVLKLIFLMDRQLLCNSNHHPLAPATAFIDEWN